MKVCVRLPNGPRVPRIRALHPRTKATASRRTQKRPSTTWSASSVSIRLAAGLIAPSQHGSALSFALAAEQLLQERADGDETDDDQLEALLEEQRRRSEQTGLRRDRPGAAGDERDQTIFGDLVARDVRRVIFAVEETEVGHQRLIRRQRLFERVGIGDQDRAHHAVAS